MRLIMSQWWHGKTSSYRYESSGTSAEGSGQSGKRSLSGDKQRNWGGRRNALLTWAEEEEFLAPWLEPARAGGVLVVSPLRAALAEKLGQPVKASVVYR